MSSKPKKDVVSRASQELYFAMENGSLFSNSLKICRSLFFDESYISFISIAEKNGDLKSALTYLKEKLERKAESRKKLLEASVYPFFVLLLSIAASIFIGLFTNTADFPLLFKYIFILLLLCALLYFSIARVLSENTLFEAFTAVDFLLSNGIELSQAVACAIQLVGPSSPIGKLFENARIKLSYGMDLQKAFSYKKGPFENLFGIAHFASKINEAFYYADVGGSKNDLFGRIAAYLESEKERSRTICLSLIEPLFIAITGGFLLLLLLTFFMPLINDISWI